MLGDMGQLGKELGIIAGIVGMGPGIAGGEDAGPRVEGVDLEAGIVGQGPQAGKGRVVQGLEVGVVGKGWPGFNGPGQRVQVGQANELKSQVGQLRLDLP